MNERKTTHNPGIHAHNQAHEVKKDEKIDIKMKRKRSKYR